MNAASPTTWSAKKPVLLGLFALILLVGGFGTWAARVQISGAIIASGQIEVDQNRQIVQHPEGGVVAEILVEEGDIVEENALLIRLDPTLLGSELAVVEGQYYELLARRARLEAERDGTQGLTFPAALNEAAATDPGLAAARDGQRTLFAARATSLEQETGQLLLRAGQIENQIGGIVAQEEALAEQMEIIREELENQTSLLERGLAQASRVLSLRREEARLRGQIGELAASRSQAEGRITEIDIQILRFGTERREEAITLLRDIQVQIFELATRRQSLLDQLAHLEIRAPVAGVVYGLQVFAERSVLRAADPVLYLVPQDRPLVVAARISPIHVDEIFVGQEVVVRFPGFDARTTPELTGQVMQISADSFSDERTQESYYRTEIILPEDQLATLPENLILIPGMPVESYLRTADRTPIAYLLKPLLDYFNRAFRES